MVPYERNFIQNKNVHKRRFFLINFLGLFPNQTQMSKIKLLTQKPLPIPTSHAFSFNGSIQYLILEMQIMCKFLTKIIEKCIWIVLCSSKLIPSKQKYIRQSSQWCQFSIRNTIDWRVNLHFVQQDFVNPTKLSFFRFSDFCC